MAKKKRKSTNWVAEAIADALKEMRKYPKWMLEGNRIEESHDKHDPDRPLFYKER